MASMVPTSGTCRSAIACPRKAHYADGRGGVKGPAACRAEISSRLWPMQSEGRSPKDSSTRSITTEWRAMAGCALRVCLSSASHCVRVASVAAQEITEHVFGNRREVLE